MAYTSHGHHIAGTTTENPPDTKARCGGPGLCAICSTQAATYKKDTPKTDDEALLGLATTKRLLEELICRMEITADGDFEEVMMAMVFGGFCRTALVKLAPQILSYRTVDN